MKPCRLDTTAQLSVSRDPPFAIIIEDTTTDDLVTAAPSAHTLSYWLEDSFALIGRTRIVNPRKGKPGEMKVKVSMH